MLLFVKITGIFILGLIGGAIPGPIIASVFTEVLNSGFRSSLKVVFRALLIETFFVIILLLIFNWIRIPQIYFRILSLGGVAVLIWLAWKIWKIDKFKNEKCELFSFYKIFLLTILNGGFWIFWITVSIPKAFDLNNYTQWGHYLFVFVFESGWLLATIFLAFIFSCFRPILQRKNLVSVVFKIFSLILIYFAIEMVFESMSYFMK